MHNIHHCEMRTHKKSCDTKIYLQLNFLEMFILNQLITLYLLQYILNEQFFMFHWVGLNQSAPPTQFFIAPNIKCSLSLET